MAGRAPPSGQAPGSPTPSDRREGRPSPDPARLSSRRSGPPPPRWCTRACLTGDKGRFFLLSLNSLVSRRRGLGRLKTDGAEARLSAALCGRSGAVRGPRLMDSLGGGAAGTAKEAKEANEALASAPLCSSAGNGGNGKETSSPGGGVLGWPKGPNHGCSTSSPARPC